MFKKDRYERRCRREVDHFAKRMLRGMKSFFFFSSRRRHTRYWRDLEFRRVLFRSGGEETDPGFRRPQWGVRGSLFAAFAVIAGMAIVISAGAGLVLGHLGVSMTDLSGRRSEERRVGKECRSRWSPYH